MTETKYKIDCELCPWWSLPLPSKSLDAAMIRHSLRVHGRVGEMTPEARNIYIHDHAVEVPLC